MEELTIQLPDETAMKLTEAAQRMGMTREDLLRMSVEEKLTQLETAFQAAATYVLQKNVELYKRLA